MFVSRRGNESKTFATRDDLFGFLEQENVRVNSLNQAVTYYLSHVTDDGEILQQKTIHLPLEESIDSYLMAFGQKKRGLPFKTTKSASQKTTSQEEYAERASESSVQDKTRVNGHKTVFLVLSLLALGLGFGYWHHQTITALQNETVSMKKSLQQVVKEQESLKQIPKIDVFSRYFLPHYYSGKEEQLNDFVGTDKAIAPQEGQLQSVIFEEGKMTAKGYDMTYVIGLKTSQGQTKKRLTLRIKPRKEALYGYLVMKTPVETSYP